MAYYRGANCGVLVFDVNDEESFKSIEDFHGEFTALPVENDSWGPLTFIVIGNKAEEEGDSNRAVSRERAVAYCESKKFPYFETSAKDGINVRKSFTAAVKRSLRGDFAYPEAFYALVVFVTDGLLRVRKEPLGAARFFRIAARLPLEFQMALCQRLTGSSLEVISEMDSEEAFRILARTLLLQLHLEHPWLSTLVLSSLRSTVFDAKQKHQSSFGSPPRFLLIPFLIPS